MLAVLYFVVVAALAVLSLTRRRIFVICGFYSFYALLTVLDEGNVPRLGGLTVYRALYLIIFVSLVARLIQDRSFLLRARRWPLLPYVFLLVLLLASSLYSQARQILLFSSESGPTLWSYLVMISLFWLAAAHLQQESDLKMFAVTTVAVSLTLSLWVIWNAAQLNFEAYRGGINVNQNYVSIFVLTGALPIVNAFVTRQNGFWRLLCLPALLCISFAALILASRGMVVAFVVAVIFMVGPSLHRIPIWTMLALGAALVMVLAVALFLPGGDTLLARFQGEEVGTLNLRTIIWSRAFQYFCDAGLTRMLFGQGFFSAYAIIGPIFPGMENYHNEFLRWLMDQGVIGLGGFLVFVHAVSRQIVKSNHPLKNIMIGWLAFVLVVGLSGVISDSHVFWILLGVMVGTSALVTESSRLSQPVLGTSPGTFPSRIPRVTEGT